MTLKLTTVRRYVTLLEVNRVAVTQPGLNEIFLGMWAAIKKVIPYDRAGLSLYEPKENALNLVARDGCDADSFYRIGLKLGRKESRHGWVFEHQKPIVRRDLEQELEFQAEQQNVMEGIRSYCAVPLVARGQSVGVMILLSSRRNRYSRGHAEFLRELSNPAALAINSLTSFCPNHWGTRLICPRCIASGGGQATAARHADRLSEWGKKGGKVRKKPAGGLTEAELG